MGFDSTLCLHRLWISYADGQQNKYLSAMLPNISHDKSMLNLTSYLAGVQNYFACIGATGVLHESFELWTSGFCNARRIWIHSGNIWVFNANAYEIALCVHSGCAAHRGSDVFPIQFKPHFARNGCDDLGFMFFCLKPL